MHGRFFRQVERVKSRGASGPSLPFSELLSENSINEILASLQISFRERVYTPVVTLWIFLSQVLSADQSCRSAVANYIAFCVGRGERGPSLDTTSYCQARIKLPEELLSGLAIQTGQALHAKSGSVAPFSRPVKVVDGSTASMPDEPANAEHFGKASNQHGEVGFPIVRFVAVFCISCGAIIELAIGPYAGKRTGELSLFRQLLRGFQRNDILLGDELFCNYCDIAILLSQGVDVVMRLRSSRIIDFRTGKSLGRKDHQVAWKRPAHCPNWLTDEEFSKLPSTLVLRELRVEKTRPGFRSKKIDILTSLLDVELFSKAELAGLFRQRWHAELDLQAIKVTLQMDVLRCKTPSMVRKEIWAHVLGYNLIRSLMSATAFACGVRVRELSFKAMQQLLSAFWHSIVSSTSREQIARLYEAITKSMATQIVGKRPNRFEPRKKKRHEKPYPAMKLTRGKERTLLLSRA